MRSGASDKAPAFSAKKSPSALSDRTPDHDRITHRANAAMPSIDFQRDRLVLVNAGIIDGVRNVVVYANIGHSVFSDDGGHFYAGGGFKVVIGR
jgi:hypothetical protein